MYITGIVASLIFLISWIFNTRIVRFEMKAFIFNADFISSSGSSDIERKNKQTSKAIENDFHLSDIFEIEVEANFHRSCLVADENRRSLFKRIFFTCCDKNIPKKYTFFSR